MGSRVAESADSTSTPVPRFLEFKNVDLTGRCARAMLTFILAHEGQGNVGYGGPVLRLVARSGFLFAPGLPPSGDRTSGTSPVPAHHSRGNGCRVPGTADGRAISETQETAAWTCWSLPSADREICTKARPATAIGRKAEDGSGGAATWHCATSRASPATACSTSTAASPPTTSSRSPRRSRRAWRACAASSTGSKSCAPADRTPVGCDRARASGERIGSVVSRVDNINRWGGWLLPEHTKGVSDDVGSEPQAE